MCGKKLQLKFLLKKENLGMLVIYCNMGRVNNPLLVMHLLQCDTVTSGDTQPTKVYH
jgi:hypothetical protein